MFVVVSMSGRSKEKQKKRNKIKPQVRRVAFLLSLPRIASLVLTIVGTKPMRLPASRCLRDQARIAEASVMISGAGMMECFSSFRAEDR